MVLFFILLAFIGLPTLSTWEFLQTSNPFDPFEEYNIPRPRPSPSPRLKELGIRRKVEQEMLGETERFCSDMYKTDVAPFTAIILYRTSGRLLCMGSIVDRRHILTAKRCYEKCDVADLRVVVGYYKAWWGEHAQVLKVVKIIRHEYEVAMLRLAGNIRYTDYIEATKLPPPVTKTITEYEKVFAPPYKVVGFDVDRFDVPGDFVSKEKVYAIREDQLCPFDECKKNYTRIALDKNKLFCSIGNATYCWGGWGGPVLKWLTNLYFVQIGLVIADNCTSDTTGPYLIARTDVYADWIKGNSHGHTAM